MLAVGLSVVLLRQCIFEDVVGDVKILYFLLNNNYLEKNAYFGDGNRGLFAEAGVAVITGEPPMVAGSQESIGERKHSPEA
jgi:hypothetical protein